MWLFYEACFLCIVWGVLYVAYELFFGTPPKR